MLTIKRIVKSYRIGWFLRHPTSEMFFKIDHVKPSKIFK